MSSVYYLRFESRAALWSALRDASEGSNRPLAFEGDNGTALFDLSRVIEPWPEMGSPEPVYVIDPETGLETDVQAVSGEMGPPEPVYVVDPETGLETDVQEIDPETGEPVMEQKPNLVTARKPNGFWLTNVYMQEPSEALAEIALNPAPATPDRVAG